MQVRDAERAAIEAVLRRSHEIWGEGLSADDYVHFNLEQKSTAWGRERYRFLVADVGGTVVSALKLYSFPENSTAGRSAWPASAPCSRRRSIVAAATPGPWSKRRSIAPAPSVTKPPS
jgi:hypothetical protein